MQSDLTEAHLIITYTRLHSYDNAQVTPDQTEVPPYPGRKSPSNVNLGLRRKSLLNYQHRVCLSPYKTGPAVSQAY